MTAPSRRLVIVAVSLACGCGTRTELLDPYGPAGSTIDAHDITDGLGDDAADETPYVPPMGECDFDGKSIACDPGKVCHANYRVGPNPIICERSNDTSTPCGIIACGELCVCADTTTSTCACD